MAMILLFEGTDGAGKSTTIKLLSRKLNIPYYKGQGPTDVHMSMKDRAIVELNQMSDFLAQTGFSVIIDRNYLSEWVYGSIFHREIDELHLREIDKTYSKIGAINIILTASDETLKKRYEDRGDKLMDLPGITMVRDKYGDLSENIKTPSIIVDTSDMSPEEVVDFLVEQLEELREDGHIDF